MLVVVGREVIGMMTAEMQWVCSIDIMYTVVLKYFVAGPDNRFDVLCLFCFVLFRGSRIVK